MFKFLSLSLFFIFVIGCTYGQDATSCDDQLPFYHGKLGDNWPLAGVADTNTSPAFSMGIKHKKDLNLGEFMYKPGKKYAVRVTANKDVTIKRMYVTAEKLSGDDNCQLGHFKTSTKPKKASALSSECQTFLVFESKKRGSKKVTGKWMAPSSAGCSIALRLTLVGSDNKIYSDDIENDQITDPEVLQHNTLTMLLKPKQKKN